jgi:predicted nucleotidyltransferase component of viral defense system
MSETPPPAVEPSDIVDVDIRAWVETAANDPVRYRDRQVTEIILSAIGLAPTLGAALVLKGGTLMALAFGSLRLTGDIDFTADADPEDFDENLTQELNALLPKTAIQLGYLDLVCRVQSIKKLPRSENFEGHSFPALLVRIGSALRRTPEEGALDRGRAPRVVQVEISFRDQVYGSQSLQLSGAGAAVRAFTLHEIIAEKLRALLQQPRRNRNRRQDVYDIAFLLDGHALDNDDRALIHRTLIDKCATRDIYPDHLSLENPEVIERAKVDWDTLKLEVSDLPPFEERFALVLGFYKSLPWT